MYRFIESIRLENHRLQHLDWHNKRLNETRRRFFPSSAELDLHDLLVLPSNLDDGVYKCRVVYDAAIIEVTFQPYIPKSVHALKLVMTTWQTIRTSLRTGRNWSCCSPKKGCRRHSDCSRRLQSPILLIPTSHSSTACIGTRPTRTC